MSMADDYERLNELELTKGTLQYGQNLLVTLAAGADLVIASKDLIRFVTDRPGHDHRYAIDSARITRQLGWQVQVGFEAGLRQTIEWYLANPKWVDEASGGSYGEWIKRNYAWRAGQARKESK